MSNWIQDTILNGRGRLASRFGRCSRTRGHVTPSVPDPIGVLMREIMRAMIVQTH